MHVSMTEPWTYHQFAAQGLWHSAAIWDQVELAVIRFSDRFDPFLRSSLENICKDVFSRLICSGVTVAGTCQSHFSAPFPVL
jgi:hypothetical protein